MRQVRDEQQCLAELVVDGLERLLQPVERVLEGAHLRRHSVGLSRSLRIILGGALQLADLLRGTVALGAQFVNLNLQGAALSIECDDGVKQRLVAAASERGARAPASGRGLKTNLETLITK